MDDRIRDLARAARAEAEASLDVDAGLAAVTRGAPADLEPRRTLDGPRRPAVAWMAAAAAVVVVAGGLFVLRSGDDDTLRTAEPATAPPTTPDGVTAPSSTTPATPSTTSPMTTTTLAPVVDPVVRPGSIDLRPGDLIARTVDGDVWWYPGALGTEPVEPILLIDRVDPRVPPDEGGGPNFIDQVAGTFDGSLVYSDCCEPVSGNLFAIAEAGAEAELWSSPTGLSDRAQLWGVGHDPELEPGGTRVLAYNWDIVNVVDLATGVQQFVSPGGGFADLDRNMTGDPFNALDAGWTSAGHVALLGWSEEQGLILTEHSPDDVRTELRRIPLAPEIASHPSAVFVGGSGGYTTIAVFAADGLRLLDVDTERWQAVEAEQVFALPRDASFARLSPDGTVMAWIVDDVAHVQQVGEEPFVWRDGIAEVWFPVASGTPAEPTGVLEGSGIADTP